MSISYPAIAVTVGQATCTPDMLLSMHEAGATLFRYNLAAQLGLTEHRRRMDIFRTVQGATHSSVKLLLDVPFPGAKFRVGMLPERKHLIETGTTLTFTTGQETNDINTFVPVDVAQLGLLVTPGATVTIGDGELAFHVDHVVDDSTFVATAITSNYLPCQKSLNTGRVNNSATQQNGDLVSFLAEISPEYIAFSFVEDKEGSEEAFSALAAQGLKRPSYKAIAKIETLKGVRNLQSFAHLYDGIMVARGDLALNVDCHYLGEIQDYLINFSKQNELECIVSTQVCESIDANAIPNRAELVGMYQLAKSGADFILLAKETSTLSSPLQSINAVQRTIAAAKNPLLQ
ncbi:pyruvate kinase [Pseudomonas sp. COR18]|uniref:pyruvate kinase n=1 Tax=Pseudomonas sp. COR18 TaxID=3399680 RepID=UPI003AFFE4D1